MTIESYSFLDQQNEEFLLSKIKAGNAVLFLGAGASISAGVPSTNSLIDELKKEFKFINSKNGNFNDLCTEIAFTSGYGHRNLYEVLERYLRNHTPSDEHLILTHYDWAAIFTTNYDDLIEQSYRSKESLKQLRVIRTPQERVNLKKRDLIYLFKLMGDVERSFADEGEMVLTTDQYLTNFRKRAKIFDYLYDLVIDGVIIFIGYSFRDLIALDVLNQLAETYGTRRLPEIYAFFRSNSSLQPFEIERLKKFNVKPVYCDFKTFFKFLSAKFDARDLKYDYKESLILKILDNEIDIPFSDVSYFDDYFDILSESAKISKSTDLKGFFCGKDYNWGVFNQGWDFPRHVYSNEEYILNISEHHDKSNH